MVDPATNQEMPNAADVPYEETVKALQGTIQAQQVAAQAINRLETFVFSITKIIQDKGIMTLDDLSLHMDELRTHETLDTFWTCTAGEGVAAAEAAAAAEQVETTESSEEEATEEEE